MCKLCDSAPPEPTNRSPRKCAFKDGKFNNDNYRCLTVALIRELADRWDGESIPGIYHRFTESNQNYSTFDISELPIKTEALAICLWVGWYKRRGRTEGMYLMFDSIPPREPTEEECMLIYNHYNSIRQLTK